MIGLIAVGGMALSPRACQAGLLYYAGYELRDNTAAVSNPNLEGAIFNFYWSQIEPREGEFDWTDIDRHIAPWINAGKKVALRIMWSTNGTWPNPMAKHPTPQWVIDRGATILRARNSQTEVPLPWDPIYRDCAGRFLQEMARRYDGNPNILFIDITPGAETNPYRIYLDSTEPGFRRAFLTTPASDGSRYSDALWLQTIRGDIDRAVAVFRRTKLLVVLNAGSLQGPSLFASVGDHAVARGCFVGQAGLDGKSYLKEGPWKRAFLKWGEQTKLYFEMVGPAGPRNGSLMDILRAAERIHCDYLGVYAIDVLKGTAGQRRYDPQQAEVLAFGARIVAPATRSRY